MRSSTWTRRGPSPSCGCSRPGRARRGWSCRRSFADGAKVWHWNGLTPSGRPVSAGHVPRRDRDARRGRQPRALAAAQPPRPPGHQLRRQAARPRRDHGALPRRAPAQRRHAGRRPGRVLRRRPAQAMDVVGAPGRVDRGDAEPPQDVGARAPARSGARVRRVPADGAHRHPLHDGALRGAEPQAPRGPRGPAGDDLAGPQLARRRR